MDPSGIVHVEYVIGRITPDNLFPADQLTTSGLASPTTPGLTRSWGELAGTSAHGERSSLPTSDPTSQGSRISLWPSVWTKGIAEAASPLPGGPLVRSPVLPTCHASRLSRCRTLAGHNCRR